MIKERYTFRVLNHVNQFVDKNTQIVQMLWGVHDEINTYSMLENVDTYDVKKTS